MGPKTACTTPFGDGEMETVSDPTPTFPRIPKASRTKVWEAADAILLGTGERPTVEGIRLRLGGGSPNSVTADLNEWSREAALTAARLEVEGLRARQRRATPKRPRAKPSRTKATKRAQPKRGSRSTKAKSKAKAVPKRSKAKQTRSQKARRRH